MQAIQVLVAIGILGFLCYLVTTYVPMPEKFKQLIVALAIFVVIIGLLQEFNVIGGHFLRLQ